MVLFILFHKFYGYLLQAQKGLRTWLSKNHMRGDYVQHATSNDGAEMTSNDIHMQLDDLLESVFVTTSLFTMFLHPKNHLFK
ncbi:hypothetical protein ACH3XW_45340 [Acanthocheilonema viteae]